MKIINTTISSNQISATILDMRISDNISPNTIKKTFVVANVATAGQYGVVLENDNHLKSPKIVIQ